MNKCCGCKGIKLFCIPVFMACGLMLQEGCVSRDVGSAGDVQIEICVPDSRGDNGITTFIKTNVRVSSQHDVSDVLNILNVDSKPFDKKKRIFLGFETAQVFERNGVPYMISTICANGHVCVLRELDVYKSDLGYILYGFKEKSDYDNYSYYQWFHDYFESAVDSDPAGTIGAYRGRARYNLIRSIMQGKDARSINQVDDK